MHLVTAKNFRSAAITGPDWREMSLRKRPAFGSSHSRTGLLQARRHEALPYIGEHIVSDFGFFDDYLAKAVPMIERFGGRYLTKAGSHEILEGD